MKILIIEDDKIICDELMCLFKNACYFPIILKDFNNPLEEINKISPDLIILDINIPNIEGKELLKLIRKTSSIPIIMVTSDARDSSEVISMSYGADDYITKPYNPTILLLRINAIFKRCQNNNEIIEYKDIKVNIYKGIIEKDNIKIDLTKNEMIILNYLLSHKERLVTRDELMTCLWNNDEYINDNALTVNIHRLREKLKELGLVDVLITKRGVGYILL